MRRDVTFDSCGTDAAWPACAPAPGAARKRRAGRRAEQWGRAAEDQAADWYRARGGAILARRARTAGGEIDLVVRLGDLVAFVEVKARRAAADAFATLTAARQARLRQAAACWLAEAGVAGDARIDVAAVDGRGAVTVLENAVVG